MHAIFIVVWASSPLANLREDEFGMLSCNLWTRMDRVTRHSSGPAGQKNDITSRRSIRWLCDGQLAGWLLTEPLLARLIREMPQSAY